MSNIKKLWPITLLLVISCQTTNIPNVKFYTEIPFDDCPEGIFVESITHKTGNISCEEWKTMRPYMIMVDPKGKETIFEQWYEACRWAQDKNKCNVQVSSVKKGILFLDNLASKILGPSSAIKW